MARRKINKVGVGCCLACTVLGYGFGWTFENLHPAEKEIKEVQYIDVPMSQALQTHVTELCNDNDVPVALAYAIIDTESDFNADTISDTSDYGLMQINAIMRQEIGEDVNLLNPYQNTKVGIELLGKYWKEFDGDVNKVAMAYNLGVVGAKQVRSNGYSDTAYSKRVSDLYEMYGDMIHAK